MITGRRLAAWHGHTGWVLGLAKKPPTPWRPTPGLDWAVSWLATGNASFIVILTERHRFRNTTLQRLCRVDRRAVNTLH